MNKDRFFTMDVDKRAEEINKMLVNSDLKGVAEALGLAYSTFTKSMQTGDYTYIARENQYFKFIRDKELLGTMKPSDKATTGFQEELTFLKENLETLKSLVSTVNESPTLVLDKDIYNTKAKYVNKNLKLNENIYEKFSKLCENQFPHLKIQDLIAESLLEFINKYQEIE
ncbi:hypothetical protein [Schinkia azotoformans]|uniref:hypothetical protein n=1 Tax=Schinkia azotoformans TaxID=1454 RepID=UPI002DB930EA|nr:hypothetical protein [Schinkia azotoformans]MEC1722831.1 hypothetical protein [Schinkia azotoformans]MED4414270.1 hypothetical protein [Schinkia azotoformans]